MRCILAPRTNERGGHVGPGYVPRLGEDVRWATSPGKTSQGGWQEGRDPQIENIDGPW